MSFRILNSGRSAAMFVCAAAALPAFAQQMNLTIKAYENSFPPPGLDVWFSTEMGFTSAALNSLSASLRSIADGDLLSRTGHVVRRNEELTGKLGIMPSVPPLGLDAAMLGPRGTIWFSFEETMPRIWSETLGVWLKHGDLLSETGVVVRSNEQLLAKFVRMPPVADAGLDAVARAPNGAFLFSTETDFFSQSLGVVVTHGDLLSDRGVIVRRNQDLLRGFKVLAAAPMNYGLDAVVLRSNGEIWFSTEVGFQDARLGPISDGDLLSTSGYVVARNRDLVSVFAPVEDVDNFGLDAAAIALPVITGDLDLDGDVDQSDFGLFQANLTGPLDAAGGVDTSEAAMVADMDGDGDVDLDDYGVFQRCVSGPGMPTMMDGEE